MIYSGKINRIYLPVFFLLLLPLSVSANEKPASDIAYRIDFTDYTTGSIDSWLRGKGFRMEADALERTRLDFDIRDNALVLNIKSRSFGLFVNDKVDITAYSNVRFTWGINKFPNSAA